MKMLYLGKQFVLDRLIEYLFNTGQKMKTYVNN